MKPYISVFDIYEDNKILKERITQLENELAALKETNSMQGCEITELKDANMGLKKIIEKQINEDEEFTLKYYDACKSAGNAKLLKFMPELDGIQVVNESDKCRVEVLGHLIYDEKKKRECNDAKEFIKE
jgi:hypothetical protein